MSAADTFVDKWKIIEIRDSYTNNRIGWCCPECKAQSGFLNTLDHKRSCPVPDYKPKPPANSEE